MKEEPFGPIVPILTFKNFDEAKKRANNNDLGLCSYVYTTDLKKADEASEILETVRVVANTPVGCCGGTIWWNKTNWLWTRRWINGVKDYLNIKYTHFGISYE